jgi:hypothetical protein
LGLLAAAASGLFPNPPQKEKPAALIGALNSPRDKSADKRQSLETKPISRGTESSNPPPSSGESTNFRFLFAPSGE